MCKNCRAIEEIFRTATLSPHLNYLPTYRLMAEMIRQKRLSVFAGDCRFEDALEVLDSEKHFTVSFYLKCEQCGELFFYGADEQ